ncbi:MAG TPA: hybrid sensor histidine kinase/response regulator [Pirellulales bacterium]|jgi:hypothetical protein|nr:hybrid sensor histidine kinase/response regulator [Pirellulales bacterium]
MLHTSSRDKFDEPAVKGQEMDCANDIAVTVLMVEDDAEDVLLITSALNESERGPFKILPAPTLSDGLDCLKKNTVDVVLLDLFLPDSEGLESLMMMRRELPDIPVVVLTGLADEQTAIESLHNGAQDYLVKGTDNGALVRGIRHAIERQRLITSLRGANKLLFEKNERLVELCDTAHQFVDNLSHEFRTPLTVIKEFSSLLLDGICGPMNHEQRRSAQVISDRADDLACMVNDMMDVSRLKAGILSMWRRPTRLAEIVLHIRPMLERRAARGEVRLEIDNFDNLPAAFCDAGKVGQIITNLVLNSIKFTSPGGCVRLWAHVADNSQLKIGVTDNGHGIEQDKLQLIFDRFTQLNHEIASSTKGVGLGLAIVKEFVCLNLGEISVESSLGKGSTFAFSLPQANSLAVFDCYFPGLQVRSSTDSIGLLQARLKNEFDPSVLPVVDEFLQRTVRTQDVTWMKSAGRWLILINGSAEVATDAMNRIRAEWTSTCRNWIHGCCPELTIQNCGNWPLAQAHELRMRFGTTVDALESKKQLNLNVA